MLAHAELMELYRSLEDEPTLSVYIDADEHDPAARSAWRTRLEAEVSRVRHGLDQRDTEAFETAWQRVWGELREYGSGFLPGAGLVAFATEERLVHVARFPVAPPDMVRWEQGLRAAPYIRVLKQERTVAVALTDRERARIFSYRNAEFEERPSLRADTDLGDIGEASVGKRSARSSGRRGETATDQGQRIMEVEADRLLSEVARRVEDEAGREGFIILGGTQETVSRVAALLSKGARDRSSQRPSLHVEIDMPSLKAAVRDASSDLTEEWQRGLVDAVLDAARSRGKGAAGRDDTMRALREHRVGTLLLARSFISDDPDLADRCVGTAFAQGADVEEVGGAQGNRLMAEAEGLAARLRFRIRQENGADEPVQGAG